MNYLSISNSKYSFYLIRRLCIFIILLSVVLVPLYVHGRETTLKTDYARGVILKFDLLQNTPGPRILLVGGSGTVCAYDSELLSQLTNYSVINTATSIFVGLNYSLNLIEEYANSGDIIIFAPEYHLLLRDMTNPDKLAELCTIEYKNYTIIESSPKLVESLFSNYSRTIRLGLELIFRHSDYLPPSESFRTTVYGDLPDSLHTGQVGFEDQMANNIDIQLGFPEKAILSILETASYCNSVGARMFLLFPAVPDSFYNKPSIHSLASNMQNEMYNIALGTPSMSVYENSDFYDSIYHLNANASHKRTFLLFKLLKAKIYFN